MLGYHTPTKITPSPLSVVHRNTSAMPNRTGHIRQGRRDREVNHQGVSQLKVLYSSVNINWNRRQCFSARWAAYSRYLFGFDTLPKRASWLAKYFSTVGKYKWYSRKILEQKLKNPRNHSSLRRFPAPTFAASRRSRGFPTQLCSKNRSLAEQRKSKVSITSLAKYASI